MIMNRQTMSTSQVGGIDEMTIMDYTDGNKKNSNGYK